MNSSAVSFVALALGATALVLTLVDSSAPAAAERSPDLPERRILEGELDARWRDRLDALAESQRELADRLAMLENGVVSRSPASTSLVTQDELDALRDEISATLGGGSSKKAFAGDEVPSPEFTERVEQSMAEIRVKDAREDAARAVAWRAERLREKLPDVAQQLGLTAQQESSLEASLVMLYERRANYGVLWESGEVQEKSEFREIEQENMTAFMTDLGGFLTPQQLEDYLALQGDVFPGGEDGGK